MVRRVVVELPHDHSWVGPSGHIGFQDSVVDEYRRAVAPRLPRGTLTWLYTPLALPIAESIEPEMLVFDVMDDLAAFKDAPPQTRRRHVEALAAADLVFTGGRSLQASVTKHRRDAVHCFPSGVERAHFARAVDVRVRRAPSSRRPTAGYVGVIDERVDLSLIANLTERMPDW